MNEDDISAMMDSKPINHILTILYHPHFESLKVVTWNIFDVNHDTINKNITHNTEMLR